MNDGTGQALGARRGPAATRADGKGRIVRIRTGLGVLTCCVALTACTAAARKGPDATVTTPAVGRPPAPASAQAALSSEAFTPYAALGLSDNDGLAPGESVFTLAGACMNATGYPSLASSAVPSVNLGGPAGLLASGNTGARSAGGGWGYLGSADAQQYGFRNPQPGSALSALLGIDAVPPQPTSLSPAEQAPVGKCSSIVQDFSNAVDDGPLAGIATLSNDIATDVLHDPAVHAATRAWSACMAKNGYSFDQPQAAVHQEMTAMYGPPPVNTSAAVSAAANRAQIAAAVTDSDCTQSSDLAGIYFAVQASYEQQLVTANQQALTAAVSAYRAAYRKELTKLAALLRTAKAQPFPQAKPSARRGSRAG
jgi:hypothetical protein